MFGPAPPVQLAQKVVATAKVSFNARKKQLTSRHPCCVDVDVDV